MGSDSETESDRIVLTDGNYDLWKKYVTFKLKTKALLYTIDDTIVTKNKSDATKDKEMARAFLIIFNSLSVELKHEMVTVETAKELWTTIGARMGVTHHGLMFKLEGELETYKAPSDVVKHCAKLHSLFIRYEKQGGCLSNLQKVTKLLRGLPRRYRGFILDVRTRNEYHNSDGEPDYEKVRSELLQRAVIEKQFAETDSKDSKKDSKIKKEKKDTVNRSDSKGAGDTNANRRRRVFKCFACGEKGHSVKSCPDQVKKDKWLSDRNKKSVEVKKEVNVASA